MEKYIEILKKCELFRQIKPAKLMVMLKCLGAQVRVVSKNQIIFQEGDPAKYVGILLKGSVQIVRDDYYGNRSIVAGIEPGQLFAESFSCAEADVLPISVTASEDSEIMLIDCRRILTLCTNTCEFHHQLVKNLLRVVAEKNLMLTQKIEFTSQKTTRDKLTAYLLFQAKKQRSSSFTIPYDRQALADYLGVERSAMSAELSKMRKEGLLECRKNSFTLLDNM